MKILKVCKISNDIFKSKAQQKYLFAKQPEVAKEFAKKTPKSSYAKLPEHV